MSETLLSLIDSADADGIHRFRYAHYLEQYLPKDRQGILRDIMEHEMAPAQFVGARIRRGMTWAHQFEASVQRGADGHWEGRINLAKALGLPGVEPAKEMAALRTLLVDIRDWLAETPSQRRDVQLCNNRDSGGRVYATVHARIPDPEEERKLAKEEGKTRQLGHLIEELGLTDWTRQVALSLGQMGPWSWWAIGEEQLFPEGERPYENHRREEIRQKAAAEKTLSAEGPSVASSPIAPRSVAKRSSP